MRRSFLIALLPALLLLAILLPACNSSSSAKPSGILSVNDIQADPSAYKGTITITGVAAGRSHFRDLPQNIFLIIETSEAKICKDTGCARFYLPVKFEGKIPQEWDEVNVTGSFAENGKFFVAAKVDVLRHLTFK